MSHAALPADTLEQICAKARLILLTKRQKRLDQFVQETVDDWNYYWLCRVFGFKPKWTPEKVKKYFENHHGLESCQYYHKKFYADEDLEVIDALAELASLARAASIEDSRCGTVNLTAKDCAILTRWT